MNEPKIILFGTGYMGLEYAKVLKAQGHKFIAVGRGKKSANIFQKNSGIKPFTGGASKYLSSSNHKPYKAIVAVTGDQLGKVTLELIKHGVKSILVEKPGGLDEKEIHLVRDAAKKNSVDVFVAYNRRFYISTIKAKEIIVKDRGVLSFHFEFNEPGYKIPQLEDSEKIQQNWLVHNSSHVIDLAFFLGGKPKALTAQVFGFLDWHNGAAIFTGCGITQKKIPFTYHANWLSPGRWGLEIMTKNNRLIFRPMEKLQTQKRDSFEIVNIELDDNLDINFKPGLYREVESFLNNHDSLCTIEEQLQNIKWYDKILC